MTIYEALQETKLPCAYSHFKQPVEPPYLIYTGGGQDFLDADNTHYWRENSYRVEYYFTEKDEAAEAVVEAALLAAGYNFEKSEDAYIESEQMYVIYYDL